MELPDPQTSGDGQREELRVALLHPATSPRVPGTPPPSPTLYVPDRLLVSGFPGDGDVDGQLEDLRDALVPLGVRAVVPQRERDRVARLARSRGRSREVLDEVFVLRVVLEAEGTDPVPPPDAWLVLQHLRRDPALARRVSLDHVVRPADGFWGGVDGFWGGVDGYWGGVDGYWGGVGARGLAEYGAPGRGGRMPVALVVEDPSDRSRDLPRHPVVALPDTGIGRHPWFDGHPRVLREVTHDGAVIGGPDADLSGTEPDRLTGQIGRDVGHGTFVAGLVRQGCPEATILTIPVLTGTGIAAESGILEALTDLLLRHVEGQDSPDAGGRDQVVDVLSLSIGYYPEAPEPPSALKASPLGRLLRQFGENGTLVVAAVGNDATEAPFVPAALAGATGPDALPVVAVGALNPDGSSVALFSNAPAHVSAHRLGVAVVSTVPTADAGLQSSTGADLVGGHPRRATLDPDNYAGGFAVWSGTSFATPVLAAELAACLCAASDVADVGPAAMRARGWDALRTCLGWSPT
ncbi:S8/S53 family peptidase [Intrasporangium sp.]|uniref:S8/S53 family peptidase n=1 Tax=Intrasporangium sp. TaxID=1925024 RepID=UPI002D79E627|nr:S8/S53 family peptidase [Intrasporangium sp.]